MGIFAKADRAYAAIKLKTVPVFRKHDSSAVKELKKSHLELIQPAVRFLYEQDGPAEGELKRRISLEFDQRATVLKAYLVNLDYGTPDSFSTAVCLKTRGQPDLRLIERIGAAFRSLFGAQEHLDILFISDEQENEVRQVCRPFYSK